MAAARRGGRWKVYVADAPDQQEALKVYDGLRGAGFPAEIRPQHSAGRLVYRVHLSNLPSEAEAKSLASRIKALIGGHEPRVTRS